ncbi:MAG: GNAT family N-acetyltransferase, partial [Acidimicrobiales bacterium]
SAWMNDVIDSFGRRLDLSFVAFDGEEMVAYCLNGHYPADEELTGRRDGWIDSICTLASHRGKGIASGLIVHSLHAFSAAGLNSSMLGVDSDNPTGAYGIYERLGYRSLQKNVASVLTIRSGTDPVKMF